MTSASDAAQSRQTVHPADELVRTRPYLVHQPSRFRILASLHTRFDATRDSALIGSHTKRPSRLCVNVGG